MITGFALLLIAGICQGSFGLGYKKYPPFSWEAFWMIYSALCMTVSIGFALILNHSLFSMYMSLPASASLIPLLCGAFWGLSAIAFSKGIDLIGVSLVYGLSMGISTVTGAVTPLFMNNSFPHGLSALLFWTGLAVTVCGIAVITKAGLIRDSGSKVSKPGLFLAMFAGLGSGAMNIGFSAADALKELYPAGASVAAVSSGQWAMVLLGGCICDIVICGIMTIRNKTAHTITAKGSLKRLVILFFVSMVWFSALLVYGCSSVYLGEMAASIGWILFNALALIISSMIGLKTGEWKSSKKARKILILGNIILVLSWVLIAFV